MTNPEKKVGHILKELRKNENMSQIELSAGILNRISYTRIESGEKQIAINELLRLLERLNINPSEFFYLLKSRKTTKQEWLEKSRSIFSGKQEDIENFNTQNNKIYKETNDIFYFHLFLYGKILLNTASSEDIKIIFNYLKNKENYSYFDFRLLNNIITVLKEKQIDTLINKMLPQLNKIDPDMRTDTKLNPIFINLINFSIAGYEKEKTKKYIALAKNHNESYPDIFMKANIKFLENLSIFRFKNEIKALQNCFSIIDWFNFMEYYDLANELKNDIEIYSKFKGKIVPMSEFKIVHVGYN